MLRYHPTVVADLHEMGAEEGYFFAPPAEPRHPLLSGEEAELLDVLGRANAAAFDALGHPLLDERDLRRVLPGLRRVAGPAFTGAVGMTFEQASSRGLVWRASRRHETDVRRDGPASPSGAFTTCLTTAANRAACPALLVRIPAAAVERGPARPACGRTSFRAGTRPAARLGAGRPPGAAGRRGVPGARGARRRSPPELRGAARPAARAPGAALLEARRPRWARRSRRSRNGAPRAPARRDLRPHGVAAAAALGRPGHSRVRTCRAA